jgi:hypothetical protein
VEPGKTFSSWARCAVRVVTDTDLLNKTSTTCRFGSLGKFANFHSDDDLQDSEMWGCSQPAFTRRRRVSFRLETSNQHYIEYLSVQCLAKQSEQWNDTNHCVENAIDFQVR